MPFSQKKILTLYLTIMLKLFQKEMRDMTIKEFSNLCGCNPQTIRYQNPRI